MGPLVSSLFITGQHHHCSHHHHHHSIIWAINLQLTNSVSHTTHKSHNYLFVAKHDLIKSNYKHFTHWGNDLCRYTGPSMNHTQAIDTDSQAHFDPLQKWQMSSLSGNVSTWQHWDDSLIWTLIQSVLIRLLCVPPTSIVCQCADQPNQWDNETM